MDRIVNSLSGAAKQFYETEFTFFDEVTGISKTLRDYLKKDKSEKKVGDCSCLWPQLHLN